ncbi:hypothetical protein HNY73_002322 [Argiope bruennichi]|uniref:Mutator-like transposase domain-containing protein n=1 Tax=Argiope bruennichi TaxID=94029 RepID=A0A8T0FTA3_ARGBR|nr:hypothetical protein HNY73_002322 [Argiope bruennichi]
MWCPFAKNKVPVRKMCMSYTEASQLDIHPTYREDRPRANVTLHFMQFVMDLQIPFTLPEDSTFGLCSNFCLKCKNCSFYKGFSSSKKKNTSNEINTRLVCALRIIGKGYTAGKKFFATLNFPSFLSKQAFRMQELKLLRAARSVAENSMNIAATELKDKNPAAITECGVSVDGTWQRRGFSSLNGVVSAISVTCGKVLDIEVMSQFCQWCHTKKLNLSCASKHQCANHKGSSGSMEVLGAYRIFERSKSCRKLIYSQYYGDGDSKGYDTVKDIYGKDSVSKLECIGHIQKRTPPAKKVSTPSPNSSFTLDSIPPHHYHFGGDKCAVVSDFGNALNVHIRKFRTDDHGRIFPTKNGVSFSPFVWESLSKDIDRLLMPSEKLQVNVICDSLFLASQWIENVPHVSFQRYITKQDFSRQFLPSVCLLNEAEWDRLQCIRKKISESCKSLLFGNFLKKKTLSEVSSRSPRSNLKMEQSDACMVLSTSLTEILSEHLKARLDDVMVCDGCLENQPNQLGHDCITMNHDRRYSNYGDLALSSMDIELIAKDFTEKNLQMLNYVNETFLNNLNMNLLVENASEMYISSDLMPYR